MELEKRGRVHTHLMAICWTIGLVTGIAFLVGVGAAFFGYISWWWPVGFGISSWIFNAAAKEYRKEAIKVMGEVAVKAQEGKNITD